MNPLFPDEPSSTNQPQSPHGPGYALPHSGHRLDPAPGQAQGQSKGADEAVELIRRKVHALYDDEPSAKAEMQANATAAAHRSKHQNFMHHLSTSGKSLAEIQAAWHGYYHKLSDDEKREVWQEFYAANRHGHSPTPAPPSPQVHAVTSPAGPQVYHPTHPTAPHTRRHEPPKEPAVRGPIIVAQHTPEYALPKPKKKPAAGRSLAAVKKQVLQKVQSRNQAQLKAKHHLQSLAVGLGFGSIVLIVTLFGFFNEMVIAPFIRPGSAAATPIILSTDGIAPSSENEVIIPKINLQLPLVYGTSTKEDDIQKQLEEGVSHYPSTAQPGQQGNAAYFGHSSNNIFNKGKYKFAFVLLRELAPGDIFYIAHNSKLYTYKVFDTKVVDPHETWVLNPVEGKTATAALITCDPPGTTAHRLVVWGEQVNPDPNANSAGPAAAGSETLETLPSNSPSLWSRIWPF